MPATMEDSERTYLQRRLAQEMAAAERAAGTPAEHPHKRMASLYAKRLGDGRLEVVAVGPRRRGLPAAA